MGNKQNWLTAAKTAAATTFLVTGLFGALSLRNNIDLGVNAKTWLGNILAVFVLATLFTIVHKAFNK